MAGIKGKSGRVKGIPNGLTAYERIMLRVDIQDDGCWLWTGACDKKSGYGKIKSGTGSDYVHIVAYEYANGSVPEGLTIDHICHTIQCHLGNKCLHRKCVNSKHLRAVPLKENVLRTNGFGAVNARKTGCPHNHGAYDARYPNGHRYCKQCKKEKEMRRRERLRGNE